MRRRRGGAPGRPTTRGWIFAIVAATIAGAICSIATWRLGLGSDAVDWPLFAAISVLLLVCERTPAAWIRLGPLDSVTPLWMFAFALLLLGSAPGAIAVAVVGSALHGRAASDPFDIAVIRTAGTAVSLATAAIVMATFGVDEPITKFDHIPFSWAFGIVCAGLAIVVVNAVVVAAKLRSRRRAPLLPLVHHGLTERGSADGALLALAPIWLVGIDFTPVLLPMLAIITLLVLQSTRRALEQAHAADRDPLTGLVNRSRFLERVTEALEEMSPSAPVTVLLMDLDGFKEVNDRLGHQIGDSVLVAFADRLDAALPSSAVAARLGGDEFAVVVHLADHDVAVHEFAEHLHSRLVQSLSVEGFPLTVGVSIGVAQAAGDGSTTRALMRSADVAMYKAKHAGASVHVHDRQLPTQERGRIDLLPQLSVALDRHQLEIHYQPQLRIVDGMLDGVEALIRWQHPELGLIPPSDFIGLAEQTDLIGPLTEMVIRESTRGLRGLNVKLAVNVSARNLQDRHFAAHVFTVLGETGFPPDALELEVTERAIVTDYERSIFTIERLRAAGVSVAIDDFGVGYSTYQTLRALNVDRVKIDRDFVRGLLTHPRDRLIVSSLIDLAHDLDVDVVAEGVESPQVWDALGRLGCDFAQGYGIAVPMPYADLRTWMDAWWTMLDETARSAEETRAPAPVAGD